MNQSLSHVFSALNEVILDKNEQIKVAVCCLLSQGHLLIEDLPGMGKTTLAHALADVFSLKYQRIQFTNDLLPMDITGGSVYNVKEQAFEFHQGPIFCQLLLADELNRASPKTQSALLEAMEERQVTVDKTSHQLNEPFFVIATQNPRDQFGTHELPESQLDRFFMRLSLGYPSKAAEKILLKRTNRRKKSLNPELDVQAFLLLQEHIKTHNISDTVLDYILAIVDFTRNHPAITHGLSPRASLALAAGARAWAHIEGRNFVIPEDVAAISPYICAHRLNLTNHDFVTTILNKVPVEV